MQPQTPTDHSVTIQWHPDLLGRLAELVFKHTNPGEEAREYGGLLLGTAQRNGDRVQIIVRLFTPVACSYLEGPIYHLSTADKANLQRSIASYVSPYWSCVGLYRSHCRKGLELDEQDIRLAEDCLKEPPGVFLLMAANASRGFLFDGVKFSWDPAFVQSNAPAAEDDAFAPEVPRMPSRRINPSPASDHEDAVAQGLAALAAQLQATALPVMKRASSALSGIFADVTKRRVPGWLACTLVLLVIGLFAVWKRGEPHAPVSHPQIKQSAALRSLGLVTSLELDHLRVAWNPASSSIAGTSNGTLLVTDGKALRTISLDGDLLTHGSVTYFPSSDVVKFELRIGNVSESVVAAGLESTAKSTGSLADHSKETPKSAVFTSGSKSKQSLRNSPRQIAQLKPPALSAPETPPPPTPATAAIPAQPNPSRSESAAPRSGKQLDTVGPVATKRVFPQASESSLSSLIGSVTIRVQVHIDSQGKVIRAVSSSHGGALIEYLSNLSANAAREWVFTPARRQGRDVETDTVLPFVFDHKGIESGP
jgi:hypothetical protein